MAVDGSGMGSFSDAAAQAKCKEAFRTQPNTSSAPLGSFCHWVAQLLLHDPGFRHTVALLNGNALADFTCKAVEQISRASDKPWHRLGKLGRQSIRPKTLTSLGNQTSDNHGLNANRKPRVRSESWGNLVPYPFFMDERGESYLETLPVTQCDGTRPGIILATPAQYRDTIRYILRQSPPFPLGVIIPGTSVKIA